MVLAIRPLTTKYQAATREVDSLSPRSSTSPKFPPDQARVTNTLRSQDDLKGCLYGCREDGKVEDYSRQGLSSRYGLWMAEDIIYIYI